MINISWLDLQQWLAHGTQPQDYEFAIWLNEFAGEPDDLPESFFAYDWSRSYALPLVIFYDEQLTVRTLKLFHSHLRQQSCDIENIIVVTSHGVGVAEWWNNYNQLHHEKSYQIKEWLFVRSVQWQKYFVDLKIISRQHLDKNIQRLFNSYSGTNSKLDRQYLALKLRGLDNIGVVDMVSKFEPSKQQLINHAYYLGYFKDPSEEQQIADLYDRYVVNQQLLLDPIIATVPQPKVKDELFDFQGAQFQLDRICLATVVNETNNNEPWCMVSEKTLRPFWHHSAVIHPGYKSAECLEQQGFWFPHDIIDYSYQHHRDWLTRVNAMLDSIKKTHQNMLGRYQEYWLDNYQQFRYNALLLEHYYYSDLDTK